MRIRSLWVSAFGLLAFLFTVSATASGDGVAKSWDIDVDRDGTQVTYIDDGYDDVNVYVHDDHHRRGYAGYDQGYGQGYGQEYGRYDGYNGGYGRGGNVSVQYDRGYRHGRGHRGYNSYTYYQRHDRPRWRNRDYRNRW